jgi:hypothetical protein
MFLLLISVCAPVSVLHAVAVTLHAGSGDGREIAPAAPRERKRRRDLPEEEVQKGKRSRSKEEATNT